MPTLAPSSKRAVKDRMKAPEEPDVTITREGSISKLYQRPYKFEIFFLNSGNPSAVSYTHLTLPTTVIV